MKKTILIALTFLLGSTTLIAQNNVEWSELVKKKGSYPSFYTEGGKSFYAVAAGSGIGGSRMMLHYDDFLLNADEKMKFEVDGRRANYEGSILVKGQMLVFMSQEDSGIKKLYYKIYDNSCLPSSEPVLVAEYANDKGSKRSSSFNVHQSKNKEFFCIEYSVPGKKTDNENFGYKVYDQNLAIVSEGMYDSPFTTVEADINNHYLSNTGDLFLGMKVYTMKQNGKVNTREGLQAYMIYLLQGNDMKEVDMYKLGLQLEDRALTDLTFTADDSRILTCTGLYGRKTGTNGAFYFRIDFDANTFVEEGYSEFSKEFITSDWSDREKEKAQKKEDKGKGAPTLYHYDFRDVFPTEDGGIIVMMEQYYVVVTSMTDSKGNVRYTYHYYYNDVIAYKVKNDGEFEWVQKIDKAQHSINDGGYLSSVAGYQKDGKYVLFFNDNIQNYTESGQFETPEKGVASSSMSNKKNCVARVEIDLENGETKRELFTSRSETDAYCVPKRFEVDYTNDQMLLYFQTRTKEKFGMLKF